MRKWIVIGIIILLIVSIGNLVLGLQSEDILERPPIPVVKNERGELLEIRTGAYHWKAKNVAIFASSPTSHEMVKDTKAYRAVQGEVLHYQFENPPREVMIQFLQGDQVLHQTKGDGKIKVPSIEGEYIVDIIGQWKEGTGSYAFKLLVQKELGMNQTEASTAANIGANFKSSVKLPATSMSLEAIAGRLFGKHLEQFMTKAVSEGERLLDYRIDQVDFIKEKRGSYETKVVYSVQTYSKNSSWAAQDGVPKDKNWIKGKVVFVTVSVKDEVYTMEEFSTSP